MDDAAILNGNQPGVYSRRSARDLADDAFSFTTYLATFCAYCSATSPGNYGALKRLRHAARHAVLVRVPTPMAAYIYGNNPDLLITCLCLPFKAAHLLT